MRMKKYDIRWLSLGGCIKSIIDNIYPGSQTLLTCLQQIALDANTCNLERKADQGLVNSILYDEFLYSVYMHHDSHEIVLRPLTTLMQCDHLSYFTLMEVLVEKENILSSWISESTLAIGSSLHQYIESTKSGSFCGCKIRLDIREKFDKDCREYIKRLIQQLDKRFNHRNCTKA
ncbi:unnamed protein product [Rotaria socialis]